MRYYPVYLDICQKPCLVVGGGGVATRKVKGLLEYDAKVTVISLAVSAELEKLAEEGRVTLKQRAYQPGDLAGMLLVIGATSDMALNESISHEAEQENILCNIADVPRVCNFILPSVVRRGDLQIAISTGGNSPAFAKYLRKSLESQFGQEYADFLFLMGRLREKLLAEAHQPEAHKHLFETLIDRGLLDMIRQKDTAAVDSLLTEILGTGFTLEQLQCGV